MTDEQLQAIEARAEVATLGPWFAYWSTGLDGVPGAGPTVQCPPGWLFVASDKGTMEDCTFIAHARQDIPDLLAEVRRCMEVIRAIIYASDGCQGHRGCNHSMQPWKDARGLLYAFDGESPTEIAETP